MVKNYGEMTRAGLLRELQLLQAELPSGCDLRDVLKDLNTYREQMETRTAQLMEAQWLLERSRVRYAALFECTPQPFLTLNRQGLVEDINPAAEQLLAVERQQIVGKALSDHVIEADWPAFAMHLYRCRTSRIRSEPVVTEVSLQCAGHAPRRVQLRSPVKEADQAEGLFATAIVVSPESQTNGAMQSGQDARLELALSAAGAGAWEWNLARREMRWSDTLYPLFGLEPGAVAPSEEEWLLHVHPDDRERVISQALQGESHCRPDTPMNFEYRSLRPNGEIRWLACKGQLIRQPEDGSTVLLGIVLDVTEMKQAEQRLNDLNEALRQRTQEAEQRGEQLRALALELAQTEQRERRRLAQSLHDHIQQLLVASRMGLSRLRLSAQEPDLSTILEIDGLLDETLQATRTLVTDLSPPVLYETSFGTALRWLGRQVSEKHALPVDVQFQSAIEPADSVRSLLFEAVRKLLFSASRQADRSPITVRVSAANGNLLQVQMEHLAAGLDIDTLLSGSCDASGLSQVRERLQVLGGRMHVERVPGCETNITLLAPRTDPMPRAARSMCEEAREPHHKVLRIDAGETPPAAAPHDRNRIRILLADDHKLVRQGIAGLLADEPDIEIVGHASDGRMAVEMAHETRPDVIVMDVGMPRMTGIEATRCIMSELPGVRVIGLSMHDKGDMAAAMRAAGADVCLCKSGPSQALLAAIRRNGTPTTARE